MIVRLLAALSLIVGVVTVPGVAQAATGTPVTECGATVTTPLAYLPHDLVCSTDAITIAAPDVTLDLRGHHLIGPGKSSNATAVTLGDEAGGARVVNGTIKGWGVGWYLQYSHQGLEASGLRFASDGTAISSAVGNQLTVTRSSFGDVTTGIDAGSSSQLSLQSSELHGDHSTYSTGVGDGADTGVVVEGSEITGFSSGIACTDSGCTVTHSVLAGNGTAAYIGSRAGITLTDDVVIGNEVGLGAHGGLESLTRVTSTRFVGNGTGVLLDPGMQSADVSTSTFLGNGTGVALFATTDEVLAPAAISIRGDAFRNNGDGLYITDTRVSTTVGGDVAVHNRRWGLYVAGTVTDLGGNVAWGNGEPAQCFGVTCAGH